MGQACQRRAAPAEAAPPVKAAPAEAKAKAKAQAPAKAAQAAQAPKTGSPSDGKKYSTDYSRFDKLEDSDEEEEKKREEEQKKLEEEEGRDEQEARIIQGKNPTESVRLELVDQMMALCRKNNHKKELASLLKEQDQAKQSEYERLKEAPAAARLPKDHKKPVGIISLSQLGKYTCSNDRMLVSVYGDIFDVSSRPDLYGYGPKSVSSGKDITWAIILGSETADNCNRFYDIFKLDDDHLQRYLQIVCGRLVTMEDEFGQPVGRLDKFVNERDLPPAPKEEIEECKQQ